MTPQEEENYLLLKDLKEEVTRLQHRLSRIEEDLWIQQEAP